MELDELTTAFNKMAADLQHAAELRTSLMADVSHELRTPLTVLEGNLRAALDHVYELDEEQIANLYEQTRHLIRLVSDLRELALAEAAQLPLDIKPLDVARLVGGNRLPRLSCWRRRKESGWRCSWSQACSR